MAAVKKMWTGSLNGLGTAVDIMIRTTFSNGNVSIRRAAVSISIWNSPTVLRM